MEPELSDERLLGQRISASAHQRCAVAHLELAREYLDKLAALAKEVAGESPYQQQVQELANEADGLMVEVRKLKEWGEK